MVKFLTNMMAQLNESKKDNKGFTLVELIIVVAIIAVLATVLAPQYLQYVERSRESNDIQVAQNLIDAAVIGVSDPANNVPSNVVLTITWDDASAASSDALTITSAPAITVPSGQTSPLVLLENSIIAVVGTELGTAQSQKGTTSSLVFTIDVDTGAVVTTGNWNGLLD